tara:strand:+ start:346 stop:1314 length:969 start_codon:yes stop_codon:yes gene_type:complete
MKEKNCLIFGGTGQIGRNLIRKLAKNNYRVTVVTRNSHQKANFIKTQANAGYIDIVETNPFDEISVSKLFQEADICINLVGILFEKNKRNSFKNIHSNFPLMLSKLSKKYNIDLLVHLSALGIDEARDSKYALSKLDGEKNIFNNFSKSIVLRPSIVYSVDDNFTTTFMTLLNRLPFFPLYYGGETKFTPIHCSDLIDVIFNVINKKVNANIIECVGPEVISFKNIIKILLKSIDKKRPLIPIPLFLANSMATFFELFPKPLLTTDQLRLLKYDNVLTNKYASNNSIGVPSKCFFSAEVKKYSYMWKEGGEYSTDKFSSKKE